MWSRLPFPCRWIDFRWRMPSASRQACMPSFWPLVARTGSDMPKVNHRREEFLTHLIESRTIISEQLMDWETCSGSTFQDRRVTAWLLVAASVSICVDCNTEAILRSNLQVTYPAAAQITGTLCICTSESSYRKKSNIWPVELCLEIQPSSTTESSPAATRRGTPPQRLLEYPSPYRISNSTYAQTHRNANTTYVSLPTLWALHPQPPQPNTLTKSPRERSTFIWSTRKAASQWEK